jgi:hypothetical protein
MIKNWLFWAVPKKYLRVYIFWLFMMLFGFPYIFGFYYTKLGIVMNILWYDIILYGWMKVKQRVEGDE